MCLDVISFSTELGWMALAIRHDLVHSINFGYSSELQLLQQLLKSIEGEFDFRRPRAIERDWVSRLQKFSAGRQADLRPIPVSLSHCSAFQRKVIRRCRRIPGGSVMTYGQLAAASGAPRAARAVGTTMRKNRFPLVVPCHRVIAANGLGGYSASGGTALKSRLLAMEAGRS